MAISTNKWITKDEYNERVIPAAQVGGGFLEADFEVYMLKAQDAVDTLTNNVMSTMYDWDINNIDDQTITQTLIKKSVIGIIEYWQLQGYYNKDVNVDVTREGVSNKQVIKFKDERGRYLIPASVAEMLDLTGWTGNYMKGAAPSNALDYVYNLAASMKDIADNIDEEVEKYLESPEGIKQIQDSIEGLAKPAVDQAIIDANIPNIVRDEAEPYVEETKELRDDTEEIYENTKKVSQDFYESIFSGQNYSVTVTDEGNSKRVSFTNALYDYNEGNYKITFTFLGNVYSVSGSTNENIRMLITANDPTTGNIVEYKGNVLFTYTNTSKFIFKCDVEKFIYNEDLSIETALNLDFLSGITINKLEKTATSKEIETGTLVGISNDVSGTKLVTTLPLELGFNPIKDAEATRKDYVDRKDKLVDDRVTKNANDITTGESKINANTQAISANATAISANTTGVSNNNAAISGNSTTIASNTLEISTKANDGDSYKKAEANSRFLAADSSAYDVPWK